MPEPKLSAAEAARLRAETYAPMVEADLRAIEAHVADGTLPEERLTTLLAWVESGAWSGAEGANCRLGGEQKRRAKHLAARAIERQHGGSYRARGYEWRVVGGELGAYLPGGKG